MLDESKLFVARTVLQVRSVGAFEDAAKKAVDYAKLHRDELVTIQYNTGNEIGVTPDTQPDWLKRQLLESTQQRRHAL